MQYLRSSGIRSQNIGHYRLLGCRFTAYRRLRIVTFCEWRINVQLVGVLTFYRRRSMNVPRIDQEEIESNLLIVQMFPITSYWYLKHRTAEYVMPDLATVDGKGSTAYGVDPISRCYCIRCSLQYFSEMFFCHQKKILQQHCSNFFLQMKLQSGICC